MKGKKGQPDLILFFITIFLLTIGVIMVLSASSYSAMIEYKDPYYFFKKQLFYAIVGLLSMFVMIYIKTDFVERVAMPAVVICCIMLVAVMFVGIDVNGSKRWLGTASFRFAPAEMAKPIMIVCYALWLKMLGKNIVTLKGFAVSMFFLALIPVLIVKEDLGTAVALAGALFCMTIVAGAKWLHLISMGIIGVSGIVVFITTVGYRMDRIEGFLDPFGHAQGAGWQLVQSLYALGSGWLFGVGLGNSRQKLLWLPEEHTDFIFAIIGEELGFVGATMVALLFALFVWRGCWIAINLDDPFKSLVAFGLTASVGIQALINMCVVVGLMPVTGITLPFISYGGTSLVFMLAAVGFLLNMSRYVKK